eukprot:5616620-Pleurochrysis_carterae.AAC.3
MRSGLPDPSRAPCVDAAQNLRELVMLDGRRDDQQDGRAVEVRRDAVAPLLQVAAHLPDEYLGRFERRLRQRHVVEPHVGALQLRARFAGKGDAIGANKVAVQSIAAHVRKGAADCKTQEALQCL